MFRESPDLLEQVEAENKRMTQQKSQLEGELKESAKKLQEEREKAGKKFTAAFIDDSDSDSAVDDQITASSSVKSHNSNEDDVNEHKMTSAIDVDEDEVIDLDAITGDSTTSESKLKDNKMEKSQFLNSTQSSEKSKSAQITDNNTESLSDSTSKASLLSPNKGHVPSGMNKILGTLIKEIRDQMNEDLERIVKVILPIHIRRPLVDALKPALRITKSAGIKSFQLIKKYTIIFIASAKRAYDNRKKR